MSDPAPRSDGRGRPAVGLRTLTVGLVVLMLFAAVSAGQSPNVPNRTWSLALSPDGRWFARHGDQGVMLFDVESGRPLRRFNGQFCGFSPEGTRLAVAGWTDITIYDLSRSEVAAVLVGAHAARLKSIAFTPDGRRLVSADQAGLVAIWDLAAGSRVTFRAHTGEVDYACLSPDGKLIATGHVVGDGHAVRLWDSESLNLRSTLKGPERTFVRGLMFSPDGRRLAVTGPNRVWDVETGKPLFDIPYSSGLVYNTPSVFSPDGRTLAVFESGGRVHLVDGGTGSERTAVEIESYLAWAATWSGGSLVTADESGSVTRWDADTGARLGSRSGLTHQDLPASWMILWGAFLAWSIGWALCRPRDATAPARAFWRYVTWAAAIAGLAAALLHAIPLHAADPIGSLFTLLLLELAGLIVLVALAFRWRPSWLAILSAVACVGAVGFVTLRSLGEAAASV